MFSKTKKQLRKIVVGVICSAVIVSGLPVYESTVEAAAPTTGTPGKTVEGIEINLFNYDDAINYTDQNKTTLRKIAPYFNFRGTGVDNSDSVNDVEASAKYDADGFTENHTTVERVLDSNGNPTLNLTRQADGGSKENLPAGTSFKAEELSLAYLFSDQKDHAVTAYDDITNTMLKQDPEDETHFTYNSKTYAADLDIENEKFYVQDYPERTDTTAANTDARDNVAYADFLPFNYTGGTTKGTNANGNTYHIASADTDYWFGMTMEVDFYQTKDGKLANGQEMIFSFTGDDDVWVFIDDVLVLDLGGTHGAVEGSINLSTGQIQQYLVWGKTSAQLTEAYKTTAGTTSFPTTIRACFDAAGRTPNGGWNAAGTTLGDYTQHKLKFFYMDRGAGVTNCKLDFRLPVLPERSLTVAKELTSNADANDTVKEFIEDSLSYKFRVLKADKDGNATKDLFVKAGTSYKILEGGQEAGTGTVDANGYFYLKAGQSAQFDKMLEKGGDTTKYIVEESMPDNLTGQYAGVEYQVSGAPGEVTKDEGETAEFTGFRTAYLNAEETQIVTFRNKVDVDQLSALKISKKLAAGAEFDSGKKFQMQVKLGDELLPKDTVYMVGDQEKKVETEGIIELEIGQTATIVKGIVSGTKYEVTELGTTDGGFNASYTGTVTVGEDSTDVAYGANKASGEFPLASTVHVTVTNANYDFSKSIPISKVAENNSGKETFAFEVTEVTGTPGAWTDKEAIPGTAITVEDAMLKTGQIVIGYKANTEGTFFYKISEEKGSGDFIYDDTYYVVEMEVVQEGADGKGTATIKNIWKNGTESIDVNSTLAFTNQKTTYLQVSKIVEGVPDVTVDIFNFTVMATGFKFPEPVNGEKYSVNADGSASFDLKSGERITLPKVPIGCDVTVTETATDKYSEYYKVGTETYVAGNTCKKENVTSPVIVEFLNTGNYVQDDTVVIDFGLPVDIDVLSNDLAMTGATKELESDGISNGTFGTTAIQNGKVRYTLNKNNGMSMDEPDTFTYQANYNGEVATAGTYSANVTVIPAANIYYEDDFMTFTNTTATEGADGYGEWTTDGTVVSNAVQAEDRPGEGNAPAIDANNVYGYDAAYDNCNEFSLGSARKVIVNAAAGRNGVAPKATFTFTGTGFDVTSLTDNRSGAITVRVFERNADGTNGTRVKSHIVNNYYGYNYVDGEWVVDTSDLENALYQVPVIKVENLEHGTYNVEIQAAYLNSMDVKGTGSYTIWLDAIRVYNPAKDNVTAENAYYADNEANAKYTTIKDIIVDKNTFGTVGTGENGESVEGAVFIDGKGTEDVTVADYDNQGPNNETYLKKGQAVAFKLVATEKPASVQIGAKLADGSTATLMLNTKAVKTLTTATNMFYKLDAEELKWKQTGDNAWESETIVLSNNTEDANTILSLTDLKFTAGTASTETSQVMLLCNQRVYQDSVRVMMSLAKKDSPAEDSSNEGTTSGKDEGSSNEGTTSGKNESSSNEGTTSGKNEDSSNGGTTSGKNEGSSNEGTASGKNEGSSNEGTASDKNEDSSSEGVTSGEDEESSDESLSGEGTTSEEDVSDSEDENIFSMLLRVLNNIFKAIKNFAGRLFG